MTVQEQDDELAPSMNLREDGLALFKFANSLPVYGIFKNQFGTLDGGCRVFAEALRDHLKGYSIPDADHGRAVDEIAVIVRKDYEKIDHFMVKRHQLDKDGSVTVSYYDGEGAGSESEVLRRIAIMEYCFDEGVTAEACREHFTVMTFDEYQTIYGPYNNEISLYPEWDAVDSMTALMTSESLGEKMGLTPLELSMEQAPANLKMAI